MNKNIKRVRGIKQAYYQCSDCGRQISSYDYYCYGKCNNCRF